MELVQPIRSIEKIEEIKTVLKETGTRNFLLFTMGINTGLRISDLLKLKVIDVTGVSHITIKEQKTGKAKRFPLTSSLQQALQDFTKSKAPNDYLFKSRNGINKPLSRITAYKIIKP